MNLIQEKRVFLLIQVYFAEHFTFYLNIPASCIKKFDPISTVVSMAFIIYLTEKSLVRY